MARIILNNNEYSLFDFDNEAEFEKAVIENEKNLFGKDSVYIDVKRRIGHDNHRGIPDAFLVDFYDSKNPQLYIVENELASHDVYKNIAEQITRFLTSTISSKNQIRDVLLETIRNDAKTQERLKNKLRDTVFENIEQLMIYLVEKDIKIVVVINEITADLNLVFKNVFKNQPDTVLLQRYQCGDDILYYYEPMREEIEDIESAKTKTGQAIDFDTVVCAAFEEGFKRAYIENNAWWEIRLSQEAREKLKYLAIYEQEPVAHISHYAEIDNIEPYKDTGKFILYLKNKKTVKPIPLGTGKKGEAPQAPRYTTLEKLLKAKIVSELWS